ncbi:DNA-binding response regulator, LuxR family [Aquipluma nitroreducens]|uniref:DNA-binding response regulator, LuxR family n=1 Tax=Aquipluma nitroreducens TaxID=2010828 RepID=A0A5K7S5P4_9BACT|nr:response regulator transcription factor [Aquipluma nitroreducens]BBE16827.1 DNA-binding response regulator, LuxR family [Aquipluma nitroreducens]
MSRINVLLTDDHQIIIDGLKSLLKNSDEIIVAAEANNGREALRILGLLSIDVLLMDIDMPVMNGIEALKEIRKQFRDVKVIILSMHNEAGMIKSLIDLGANGYLLKSCSQDELIGAIRKVASGQSYFSTDVTLALLKPANPEQKNEILTERETEILKLIAAGFSNKEIGDQLYISHRTVDTHRTNLMKKLDVSNIAGLISYAIKNGIF